MAQRVPAQHVLDRHAQGRAPVAVRAGKEAINSVFEGSLSDGLSTEKELFYGLFSTEDQKEGMQAFIEKRKPTWKGK